MATNSGLKAVWITEKTGTPSRSSVKVTSPVVTTVKFPNHLTTAFIHILSLISSTKTNVVARVALERLIGVATGAETGSSNRSKAARKKIVAYHKLPTPGFFVADSPDRIPEHSLKYPLFVKPLRGRGSAGISEENIIKRPEDLPCVVAKITEKIGQPALVEEFISGREITVGIIGYEEPKVLPILEIEYNSTITNTFEHKMLDREIIHCPAKLSPEEQDRIIDTATKIYKALNAKDFGRIDMILGRDGIPYFLELNTFAGLTMSSGRAHNGYMGYMAEALGMTAAEFIGSIIESAIKRYGLDTKNTALRRNILTS
ncbi:MAG: D-alanine-D-alanine ligase [Tepidanaerobacteraceae bacterium]|nr:D-alanine-D-alanine ligase [Tepidanaerobacteraceae bacterium]